MYAVTDLFLKTLRNSHVVEMRVDAYRAGALLAGDLPVTSGSVTVDSSSQVRRQLSLTIGDPSLDPGSDPTAVLAPFGTELFVRRGVRYPDTTIEWVPLGWFRIESAAAKASGDAISVTGADRTVYLQDARFTSTQSSNTSNTIAAEIARLITEVLPTVSVTNRTSSTAITPALFWEQDRWAAIHDLATSIGADVYFTPDGNAIIAPVPAITDTPAWWVDSGESGVMIDADSALTREGTYNAVVASGEAGDVPPYSATVTDDDATSPTYWSGSFGRKPYFYVSPMITTQAQATSAATALLNRVRGMSRQLAMSLVPNPALEAGDVVRVRFPSGLTETHMVDSFAVPLGPSDAMSLSTRSPKPAQE